MKYIKSTESGLILGRILEACHINGSLEYVLERGNTRYFLKFNGHAHLIIVK